MRTFWVVLRKDWLRKLRSPLAPVSLLLFPVLFSLLIGLAFGSRGDTITPIKLALVDEDGGFLSRMVRDSFNQGQGSERFDVQEVDLPTATRLVEDDKVSAVLRISAGFTDSVLAAHPATLDLVKNPAESIYPGIAEQYVKVLALFGGEAARVLGGPMQAIRSATKGEQPSPDEFVSRVSIDINRRMRAISRYAFPPAIRLEEVKPKETAGSKQEATPMRIAVSILPGMAVFALLMLALVSMQDFQREGVRGTLSRQFTAPIPFGAVIAGKIGATWLLSIVSIVLLAAVSAFWAGGGVSLAGFAALSLAFAFASTAFAAFIQSFSRNERAGSAIGSILVMIMSMAGGSFLPVEAMPGFIRRIAPFTLNYWGVEGYRKLLFSSGGLADLGSNLAVLVLLGLVLAGVATVRFTRRYGTGG